MKKILLALSLIATFSVFAAGQEMTARAAARGASRGGPISLTPPHACTLFKQHPCVYYGGDLNLADPEADGVSNENDLFIANSFSYIEVAPPISFTVSGSFSNNLSTYGVIDPKTATWNYRTGVSEGNGGTSLCGGDSAALFTATGRNLDGYNEYELLTATTCSVPKGDVWFNVTPNCTNASDPDCTSDPRYFESDTDGLNSINGQYGVNSNNGMGPTFESEFFGVNWESWCTDEGIACGDTLSSGVLK